MTATVETPCLCRGHGCTFCGGVGTLTKIACLRCGGVHREGAPKCVDCRGQGWRDIDNMSQEI